MVALTDASAHKKENGQPDTTDLCGETFSCESVIRKECNETRKKAIEL
jgi:hypothetical protein